MIFKTLHHTTVFLLALVTISHCVIIKENTKQKLEKLNEIGQQSKAEHYAKQHSPIAANYIGANYGDGAPMLADAAKNGANYNNGNLAATSAAVIANLAKQMEQATTLLAGITQQMRNMEGQMAKIQAKNDMIYSHMKRLSKQQCAPQRIASKEGYMAAPGIASAAQLRYADQAARTPQCPDEFEFNEKTESCYKMAAERVSWRMARERCRLHGRGADLVAIESGKEQRLIVDQIKERQDTRHCDFWTGGTDRDTEGHWYWIDSKRPLSYTYWNTNEPNNGSPDEHCLVMMWLFNWAWNDARCNSDNACYICEAPPLY